MKNVNLSVIFFGILPKILKSAIIKIVWQYRTKTVGRMRSQTFRHIVYDSMLSGGLYAVPPLTKEYHSVEIRVFELLKERM